MQNAYMRTFVYMLKKLHRKTCKCKCLRTLVYMPNAYIRVHAQKLHRKVQMQIPAYTRVHTNAYIRVHAQKLHRKKVQMQMHIFFFFMQMITCYLSLLQKGRGGNIKNTLTEFGTC